MPLRQRDENLYDEPVSYDVSRLRRMLVSRTLSSRRLRPRRCTALGTPPKASSAPSGRGAFARSEQSVQATTCTHLRKQDFAELAGGLEFRPQLQADLQLSDCL